MVAVLIALMCAPHRNTTALLLNCDSASGALDRNTAHPAVLHGGEVLLEQYVATWLTNRLLIY